jgi:hypothetical protein
MGLEFWRVSSIQLQLYGLPWSLHSMADVRAARTEEKVGHPGKRHTGHKRRVPLGRTEGAKKNPHPENRRVRHPPDDR